MNALRQAACILLAAASFLAPPAYATSFSTDQSDLWYVPAESGWGMQLVQRESFLFATLFVYGPSGTPTWYTAQMSFASGLTWTGPLYATTGTYFGAPWDPAVGTIAPVGTMTWTATTVDTGTLTYFVNGVTVVKNVSRQTLALDYFGGFYIGGLHEVVTACANPALNGTFDLPGTVDFVQSGTAVNIEIVFPTGVNCTYMGTLSEAGQMGAVQTTPFTCSDGSSGTIALDELQVTPSGITGTYSASYNSPTGCEVDGRIGGVRGIAF